MNHDTLKQAFNAISPITEEAWLDFSPLFKAFRIERNEVFIQEGERTFNAFFLLEGIVRVYYTKEGNDYNKTFFIPGMFPTPITALISKSPSLLSFQALTPSLLAGFSFEAFKELFQKHRCLQTLLLRIMEIQWIKKERHDIRMVTNDAKTNYLQFRKDYPELEKQIPQYHIASYLGITPIQLSRIRNQLANDKSDSLT